LGERGVQVIGREALVAELRPGSQLIVKVLPTGHADRPPFIAGLRSASMAERNARLA
jgi:hypothetical protein